MGIQTQFNKFHDKIKLGRQDDTYRKARERDDSITKDVIAEFRDAGYPVIGDFIQGSLATATAVVPLSGDYDIDRALVIDSENAPSDPVKPKITALDVLEARRFKNARIKMPCVTADYAHDSLHIDFVVYKKEGEQHYLAIGKKNSDQQNRSWSVADPIGLMNWINDQSSYWQLPSKSQHQFQRLVRYLKRWRDFKFSETVAKKIYSIGLTVMAKQEFKPSFSTEATPQDLVALLNTVNKILTVSYFQPQYNGQYRVRVALPTSPWRDIFDGSSLDTGTQFWNKLTTFRDKLSEAADTDDVIEQSEILKKQFGGDFEVPEGSSGKSGRARYATPGIVGTTQGA